MIGVPCHAQVEASFAQSLCNLVEYMTRKKYHVVVQFFEGTLVATARQRICEIAIKTKQDYLFFIDSDMVVQPDVIERLIRDDEDIVSTMFFKRIYPYTPCFYTEIELKDDSALLYTPNDWDAQGGLYLCHGTGLAATLIKGKVLRALDGERMFESEIKDIGEDLAFCLNARAKGFKVWVDTRIEAGHIGKTVITSKQFKEAKKANE